MVQVRRLKNNFAFVLRAVLSVAACLFFRADTVFGAGTNKDGWVIEQDHRDLGHNTIYVTHDAVKIVNKNLGVTVLTAPPYRTIAVYRPEDHIIFNGKPEQFKGTGFFQNLIGARPTAYPELKLYGEEDRYGLHIKKFQAFRTTPAEIWTISNISLAPPVLDLIHNWYYIANPLFPYRKISYVENNLPKNRNVWLTDNMNAAYRGKTVFLDTRSAKKMNFTAKDFAYPTGYKVVNNMSEAFVSVKKTSNITSLMEDMGIGEELGLKKEKGTSALPKK